MKKLMSVLLVLVMLLSLTACGGGESTTGSTSGDPTTNPTENSSNGPKELVLSEVYTTITSGVEMPEMLLLDSDMILDMFGIKAEYCNQSVVYLCSNSLQADEIWLLEAKDAAAMEALKGLVQSRIDQKDAESITYSPEQNAVVKAAQIIEAGNYLVMIVSPNAEAIAAAFRTAAGI